MSSRRSPLSTNTAVSHLGVLVAVSVAMGILVAGLAVPIVAALGYGTSEVNKSLDNLPMDLKAEPLAQRTRVVDAQGRLIATFYDQNRVNVALDQIAPIMRRSIVAIEDYRFFQHGALDLKGTLRAFLTNQTDGGSTQGGSSITQQLAKMTALYQAQTPAERAAATADTYARKIQELRHAIAFEQNYSKDWILNRYLNTAYFGDGVYGIQSAAEHFFSVSAAQLTVAQSSLLAGLVKNPNGYDPALYPDRAKARRTVVLMRMAQLNVITQQQADAINKQPLGLHLKPTINGCLGSKAPFFCSYVYRYLLADPALGKTTQDRVALINAGGLTIKTTMRMPFQNAATAAARKHVFPTDNALGSLAMVQPGTGNVYAVAQSRPMGRDASKGQTFLNYAVPQQYGDSGGFQAGSTFKLFVLSEALKQGLSPTATTFQTPKVLNIPNGSFMDCKGPYPAYNDWAVHNSTNNGAVTNMYSGMQLSVNNYFAQLERQTGLCAPYQLARDMGVSLTAPNDQRVPSFTLGVASVNPLEMAAAYATVASRGIYCTPRPVTEILNSSGKVFKTYPTQCNRVLTKNTADQVNDILRGVMAPGGFGGALALDKPSAGKTGTIENNMTVWFDGYTPEVATAAMIAGVNQAGHWVTLNGQVVGGVGIGVAHGSTVAGPMWADAMRAIQNLIPYKDFVKPGPGPNQSAVPQVAGQSLSSAMDAVKAAGFTPVQAGEIDGAWPQGTVAKASLGADDNTVYLYTSTGTHLYVPPPPPPPGGKGGGGKGHGGGGGGKSPGGGHGPGHGHGH